MKLPIQSPPRGDVIVAPKFANVLAQHGIGFRKIIFRQVWNRELQDLGFEQGANRKELFDIIGGQGGHNRAPVRKDGDQTFRIQLPERFANRDSADLELTGDRVLAELNTLRDLSSNNLVA